MKKVLLSAALLASFACANNNFEVTGVVGGVNAFDDYDFDDHMTFGLRFGIPANTFLTDQIELGYDFSQDVDLKRSNLDSSIHRGYLNAVKEFSDSNTRPYFLAGVGYQYPSNGDVPEKLEGAFGQYGVGLKHYVTEHFGVRGEVRHAISFESGHDSTLFYTLGLFGAFGGAEEPVVVVEEPTPIAQAVAPTPPPAPVVEDKVAKKVVLTNKHFNFGFDSAQISDSGMQVLQDVTNELNAEGSNNVVVVLEGHTDSVGTEQYNLGLSEKRAEAVKAELVKLGVSGDRISTKGYGETKPLNPNDTVEGRAENRRVEIVFSDMI